MFPGPTRAGATKPCAASIPKDSSTRVRTSTTPLTFSTGTQKHQTYFSAATTNARNILPNSGYNRYNFTFRDVTKFLKDKLTVDLSASYILQDNKNMIAAGKYFNPLPALYLFPRGFYLNNGFCRNWN